MYLGIPALIASVLAILVCASRALGGEHIPSWWCLGGVLLGSIVMLWCGRKMLGETGTQFAVKSFEQGVDRLRHSIALLKALLLPLACTGLALPDSTRAPPIRISCALGALVLGVALIWAIGDGLSRRQRAVSLGVLLSANLVLIAMACTEMQW